MKPPPTILQRSVISLRSFPPALLYSGMALKPDFGPNNQLLPPLPIIRNPEIRQQVFTHRSFFARRNGVFEDKPDDPSPDNERLEHLGDSVLSLAVTDLLLKLFPGLRVGPSTKTRALMVGNLTLADISLKYKLPDRLRLHPAQAITLRASTNIQADVFESFIGGLYLDQGFPAVKSWIDLLFPPYAIAAYNNVREQHGLQPLARVPTAAATITYEQDYDYISQINQAREAVSDGTSYNPEPTIGHLALFNQHMQKNNCHVEWDYSDGDVFGLLSNHTGSDTSSNSSSSSSPGSPVRGSKTTPMWSVRAVVDGELFGRGVGNTKKMARNEAAKEGLVKLGVCVHCEYTPSSLGGYGLHSRVTLTRSPQDNPPMPHHLLFRWMLHEHNQFFLLSGRLHLPNFCFGYVAYVFRRTVLCILVILSITETG